MKKHPVLIITEIVYRVRAQARTAVFASANARENPLPRNRKGQPFFLFDRDLAPAAASLAFVSEATGIKSVSTTEPEPTRKTCLSNVCVLTYLRALRASRGGEIFPRPRPSRVQHRREIEALSIAASKARQANHRVPSARPSVRHRSLRILNSHAIRTHISKPKRPRWTPNTRIATTDGKCAATRGNVFDNPRSVRQDGRRFVALLGISGG